MAINMEKLALLHEYRHNLHSTWSIRIGVYDGEVLHSAARPGDGETGSLGEVLLERYR